MATAAIRALNIPDAYVVGLVARTALRGDHGIGREISLFELFFADRAKCVVVAVCVHLGGQRHARAMV